VSQVNVSLLAEAFEDLRKALLYYFIGILLLFVALGSAVFSAGFGFGRAAADLGSLLAGSVLGIIGLLIMLYAIIKLFATADKFARAHPNLGGLKTALKIGIAAIGVAILGMIVMFAGAAAQSGLLIAGGYGLILIAGLLGLVANVLVGLFLLKLGDLSKEGLPVPEGFKIAGILYLIGIIIGVLQLIAIILVYLYSGEAAARLREYAAQQGQQAAGA